MTPPVENAAQLPTQLPRLAIFPLPGVHLFPHTLLPLHVFEPRYRALTHACLDGDRRMAVALLEPGFEREYEGRPAVRSVCGVGEIVQHHRHADGRYDILLRGLGRVRIVRELPPDESFRVVEALRLDDHAVDETAAAASQRALLAVCDRLASALPEGGDTLRALTRQESSPGPCADVLGAALVTAPDERQDLLESLDVLHRLDRVTTVAAQLLARFGSPTAN